MTISDSDINLFVYGSLMYDAVWSRVANGTCDSIRCTLHGWRRLRVKDADYPALVPGSGTIDGVVRLGVSKADMERLDNFEGKAHGRKKVMVNTPEGKMIEAQVYVFRKEYRHMLLAEPWSVREFENAGMERFIAEIIDPSFP